MLCYDLRHGRLQPSLRSSSQPDSYPTRYKEKVTTLCYAVIFGMAGSGEDPAIPSVTATAAQLSNAVIGIASEY